MPAPKPKMKMVPPKAISTISDADIETQIINRASHKAKVMDTNDLKSVADAAKWLAASAILRGDYATASKHLTSLSQIVPLQPPYAHS